MHAQRLHNYLDYAGALQRVCMRKVRKQLQERERARALCVDVSVCAHRSDCSRRRASIRDNVWRFRRHRRQHAQAIRLQTSVVGVLSERSHDGVCHRRGGRADCTAI